MIAPADAKGLIARLPAFTVQIVVEIIDTDVTPELMNRARKGSDKERR